MIFGFNGGFSKRKCVIFGLNGVIFEGKCNIWGLHGGFPKRNCFFIRLNGGFEEKMQDLRLNAGFCGKNAWLSGYSGDS